MLSIRSILAVLILLLSCALQFWFASANVFVNFILATLIVFAFYFDIWELLVFILFSIFVINWQPVVSTDIFIFGIIPVVVYAFNKVFAWTTWVAAPFAIVAGFIVLYLALAPGAFFANWELLLMDLFGGLLFGGAVFLVFDRVRGPYV